MEDIEGDLKERFDSEVTEKGIIKAKWNLFIEVLRLMKSEIIRPAEGSYRLNNYGMVKNYLKVAYRSLLRSKAFAFVNILGLVLAFTAVIVIFQHIVFESSYDEFHENGERIYRVEMERIYQGELQSKRAQTYSAMGPDITAEVTGVESYTRILQGEGFLTVENSKKENSKYYRIPNITFVDEAFLSIFSFGTIDSKALREPKSIVLTRSIAKRFFGEENPVGKTVTYSRGSRDVTPLMITGVIEDVPENSHMDFEVLVSYSTVSSGRSFIQYSWDWSGIYTYLLLEPGVDPRFVKSQFPDMVERHKGEKMKARNMLYEFDLKRLTDIHLRSNLQFELGENGSIQSIYFLYLAAFLILTISWLNTVNLTNVRNSMRIKEMGVRKVLGARKKQVFIQLFIESLLVNLVALGTAVVLVIVLSPVVETQLGISLSQRLLLQPELLSGALTVILVGSLISSVDPTLLQSVFTSRNSSGIFTRGNESTIRKFGIVFQFGISLVLIIVTFTVHSQLRYVNSYDLGIDKEYSVVLKASGRPGNIDELHQSTKVFKTAMEQQSWIKSISACNSLPGLDRTSFGAVRLVGSDVDTGKDIDLVPGDEDFVKTLGLKMKAGRDFLYNANDTVARVILNTKAVKLFGFESAEDAVGKTLVNARNNLYNIVGVIEDYHHTSLKKEVSPMMIWNNQYSRYYFLLNLDEGRVSEHLSAIEESWNQIYPNNPFDFFFLDEHMDQQYRAEQQFAKLFTIFSSIGILIACMGMFSLSSFYAARRTKEIGIRKVLGASLTTLIWLLSSEFILLTLIGLFVAVPIAYYTTGLWLENFAFQVAIGWWWYGAAVLGVLFIACFTVSIQTFKTANVNPSECLKDE